MNEKVTWLLDLFSYFLTPENSEVLILRKTNYQGVGNVPGYLGVMKAVFWIIMALIISLAVSNLN
ncbi:MAG: hypothetical protein GY795_43820 [Desulfobacterales bacterium]|nr:hypothetical protein [Desulfobacterales bacterium]